MKSRLDINLSKTLLGGEAQAGAVAQVISLRDGDPQEARSIVIPAGRQSGVSSIDVDPGTYVVEAMLPSGSFVREHVEVAEGETKHVQLKSDPSPREWLGWQTLVSSPMREQRRSDPFPRPTVTTYSAARMLPECWQRIARLSRPRMVPDHGEIVSTLEATSPADHQPEHGDDDVAVHVWTVPQHPDGRTIAIVDRGQVREVVAIPVPWLTRDSTPAAFEMAVPRDPAQPLGLAVRDPIFGAIIGYLGAGAVETAQRMLEPDSAAREDLVNLMHRKRDNPYAAVVAACVLVQAEMSGETQEWDGWLVNLADGFPWLPDGAALLAARQLRLARDYEQLAPVKTALLNAVHRGIPVVTAAARLLNEALTTLIEDPAIDSGELDIPLLEAVSAVMMRLQARAPFSVLRFESRSR